MTDTTVTKSDEGTVIEIAPGQTFAVRLAEIPTSGYQWVVDEMDDRVLTVTDSDFARSRDSGVGGGGVRTFTFEAENPGTASLEMELRREWEPDSPEDRFEVTIRVHE